MTRFIITFEPKPGTDAIEALRRLLKHAGRYLGLRAVDAREETDSFDGYHSVTAWRANREGERQ
jgi:hypothetical protein